MRKKKVFRNVMSKWIGTFLLAIVQFVARRVFVSSFGDKVLGLNGLLQSVISMLSLLELGVGSAIYYSLYEPLEKGDTRQIAAIMQLYKKIYKYIGIAIMVIGMGLLPFLPFFVSTEINLTIVQRAYFILLSDAALSYFLAYSRNIFNADQQEFFCTNIDTVIGLITVVCQIIATYFTKSFYLYLIIKAIGTLAANFIIYNFSKKKYQYLNDKGEKMKLSNSFMSSLKKNIKALCMVNIASYLVFGTDNILISTFTGLSNVFIYTNYNTIIGLVNKLFHNVFDSMRASVGNYMITESKEKTYGLFQRIFFLNFAVTCYTTVSMLTCFNDAITIWLGKKYIWPIITVAILVTNNYMRYIQQASAVFRNAAGIYTPYSLYKFMPIIEGSINLLFSIMFVVIFPENKATGIFIGTSVSTIFFTIYGIHALYRYYFVDYRMRTYFIKYLWYFLTTIVLAILSLNMSKAIVNWLNIKSMIIVLIIDLFVALIVSLSGIIIIFRKNEELAFYIKLFLKVLRGVEIYE